MEKEKLILQAIESAESSLKIAKDLMGAKPRPKDKAGKAAVPSGLPILPKQVQELVGVIGEFDGEFLISPEGRKYQVPPNYASKSILTPGDTLRMVEDEKSGKARFKQIKKVERERLKGVLSKKDGRWCVVTEEGSFWVLTASVKHYEGEIGDEVLIHLPKDFKKRKTAWAAVVKIKTDREQGAGSGRSDENKEAESKKKNREKRSIKQEKKEQEKKPAVKKTSTTTRKSDAISKPRADKTVKRAKPAKKKITGKIKLEDTQKIKGKSQKNKGPVVKEPKSNEKKSDKSREKKELADDELR